MISIRHLMCCRSIDPSLLSIREDEVATLVARAGSLLSSDLSLGGALVDAIPICLLAKVYLQQRPEIVDGGSIRRTASEARSLFDVSALFVV